MSRREGEGSWGLLAVGGGGNGRELCGLSYSLMDHCKLYFWPVECER